uniref:Uncharacterized protein n=1 Tax=Toxoplasma gondii TgCATBr9 TaxID=943120 RepID=A0A2T6IG81_TOXGO|nr:hypothetical protein TGBR9_384480 [Toxoplasma gondii TgCATBr9]
MGGQENGRGEEKKEESDLPEEGEANEEERNGRGREGSVERRRRWTAPGNRAEEKREDAEEKREPAEGEERREAGGPLAREKEGRSDIVAGEAMHEKRNRGDRIGKRENVENGNRRLKSLRQLR